MSTTPNLLISLIASNQASKEVTANSAISNLELALTNQLVKVLTDANYTLTDPGEARQNMVFTFTGTLTADRNIIVPAAKKLYIVSNQTTGGFNLTFETAGGSPPGTGFSVANSIAGSPPSQPNYTFLYCDGTNVFCVNQTDIDTGGSGSVTSIFGRSGTVVAAANDYTFLQISGAPTSYSGAGGKAVEVNSGATALVFNVKPFDVSTFAAGLGTASQILLRVKLARAVTFPASATLSQASASANATASTTFTLTKNGSSFATVNYATGSAAGTWTQASDSVFAAGDLLEIDGPTTADTTLANVGITLAGIRS